MNVEQLQVLKSVTCGILDRNADVEEILKSSGINKRLINKVSKALDLIFEVNQTACELEEKIKTKTPITK